MRPYVKAAALAGIGMLLAGCGGGPASTGPAGPSAAHESSAAPSAVAFSACMRSHGVPGFPDPDPDGRPLQVDAQQLGVDDHVYQVAEHACVHLLPTGGSLQERTHQCLLYGDCPQALVAQLMDLGRTYASCMRHHGVPRWPDPSVSAKGGRPVFELSDAGIDPGLVDSPPITTADRRCRALMGGDVPRLPTS